MDYFGPNGAGKSTTMNMITGYIEPTNGQIIVDGYDLDKKAQKAKRQIGYMPEGTPLYMDLTVKEFIQYMGELKKVPKKELREQMEKILKDMFLEEVQNKLIKNLSRGYKQRVSMAGALIGNPKILILDEPTVGLDPKQVTEIRNLIKSLGKEHTIILSSHILSEVSQICQKVIIINQGEIVAIDTPENLEKRVTQNEILLVTIEDKENKLAEAIKQIAEVKEWKLVSDNEDGTKQYSIEAKEKKDIRKQVFEVFASKNITIFEMKKSKATLEEAFIELVNQKEEKKEENHDSNH